MCSPPSASTIEARKHLQDESDPMTTPIIAKRERLDALIQSKSWNEKAISHFYEKADRRRIWAQDLVGLSELLARRRAILEPILGRHVFAAIRYAFASTESELQQTVEHLALAAQRSRIRPILGMAIPALSLADIPPQTLPPAAWITLADLAIIMEDLVAYMWFRSQGLRGYRAVYDATPQDAALDAPTWSAFVRLVGETGDPEMLRWLDRHRPTGLVPQDELLCDSAWLYVGDVEECRRRAQTRFSEEERAFAKFVEGRSIAMVGPVDVGLDNGAEIDRHDLVMRFNFLGMGSLSETSFGSRTDFSFYVENKLPRGTTSPETAVALNSLKYIVADYTHRPTDACFTGVDTPIRRRFPAGHPFANPLFKGTHNAIQRAIADLARFDTGPIKVFNSDLFISAKYATGYRDTSSEVLCMGFTTHDPVSNSHFTRRMLEIGVISADARLTEILTASDEDYVHQLHLRYGQLGPLGLMPGQTRGQTAISMHDISGRSPVTAIPRQPLRPDEEKPSPVHKKSAGVLQMRIDAPHEEILAQAQGKSFVHIAHPHHPPEKNIIEISRKDSQIKQLVVALANAGFSHYACRDQVSSFVFHSRIPSLWKPVIDGDFRHHDGVIYSLQNPSEDMVTRRLIVVFSSIADKMYAPGLSRMFYKNFRTIEKYLPPDTAVLRIADIGSVVGAFYLGTNFDPDNAFRVQAVIRKVQTELGITPDSVVLYGASKGATGALYHALLGNWHAVSVDPITADEHYIHRFKDSHFTIGTFPANKSEIFADLTGRCAPPTASISVITSPRSPQYPYIDRVIRSSPIGPALNYVEADNPRISDHPDVGPNTIHILTMLLNMAFYGMRFTPPNLRLSV